MATIIKQISFEYKEILHSLLMGLCCDGQCYAFAAALNRGTGLPIVGLMQGETIRHAALREPDGRLRDARGIVSYSEFGEPFGIKPPYAIKEVSEGELRAVHPISELLVRSIAVKAQVLWPELPWKKASLRSRAIAFTEELEALCRKHGLWIRAPLPSKPPLISEENGREAGYEIIQTMDGTEFFINRTFK